MKRRIRELTMKYMNKGFGIEEARAKAISRYKFEKTKLTHNKAPKLHPCAGR